MRIEWLIGERQFRLDTEGSSLHILRGHGDGRVIVPTKGGFTLTIPTDAKLWITEGENHG